MEMITNFLKDAKDMLDTYLEFPEDAERTNKIVELIQNNEPVLPIYVEKDVPDNFIMEGRHCIVAFMLLGMTEIPVARVSLKNENYLNFKYSLKY